MFYHRFVIVCSLSLYCMSLVFLLFRSTPPSRPNNIRGGLKCPSLGTSVRTSVRPQNSFFSISMKFGVQIEVDD